MFALFTLPPLYPALLGGPTTANKETSQPEAETIYDHIFFFFFLIIFTYSSVHVYSENITNKFVLVMGNQIEG